MDAGTLTMIAWSSAHGLAMLEIAFPGGFPVDIRGEDVLHTVAISAFR